MQPFQSFATHYRSRIEELLESRLSSLAERQPLKVCEAMAYSLCNGGKRIRPLLVYGSALAVGDVNTLTDNAAAAIEAIHCYSLIHDDLPAMDDDDLRRGQATCHIVYDEATAILAGDALQALAFEWLSEEQYQSTLQVPMIRLLAQASGAAGMVGGQAIDLAAVDQSLNLKQLRHMHQLKTGALIGACVKLGALSTGLADREQLNALDSYAKAIGLAFQIQDDILDVTADTVTLGKQSGADIAHNKPTFVSLLGLDDAKEQAEDLFNHALDALAGFDYRADHLRDLAAYIVKRNH
ncbi:MAG: farnesyl diphosphate synthase [Pseudomonadota bacterium]